MRRKGLVISEPSRPLRAREKAELAALAALPDTAIDTSDIPELPEPFWRAAERGKFYRPIKQQLTLRLDADLVAWFKTHATAAEGYQTRINRALREYVREQSSRGR
jgi:uncharacterized protein (DUF4415 family)